MQLDGVRPFVTPAGLQEHRSRERFAVAADRSGVVRALLQSGALPGVPDSGDLLADLEAAMTLINPARDVDMHLKSAFFGLEFTVENRSEGGYSLKELHDVLWRRSRRLLPGILAALEAWSIFIEPVIGPRGAEALAEYLWDMDYIGDNLLEDERIQEGATRRDVLRAARRFGLEHPFRIRDSHPWEYFGNFMSAEEVLVYLKGAGQDDDPLGETLAQLGLHLEVLRACASSVPEMTARESEDVCGLPTLTSLYTVSDKPYCEVMEVADQFMRQHWEGGDDAPIYVLHLDESPESHERLVAYLKAQRAGMELLGTINETLHAAETICEARRLNGKRN